MDNGVKAYASYFLPKTEIGTNFYFDINKDHFYGYNDSDTSFASDLVKQRVQNIAGDIFFKNAIKNKKQVDFNQTISYGYMKDFFKNKEWTIKYASDITKIVKEKHHLNFTGSADISNFVPTYTNDKEREIFEVGASYFFNNDDFKLKIGLNNAIGDVYNDKQYDALPIIYTEKKIFKEFLIFYTGWNMTLQKNTYLGFVSENPYMNTVVDINNTKIEDRKAGLKGSIKKFTYNFRFSNKVIKNMPYYVNDSLDMKRFNVEYDDRLTVFNINFEGSYVHSDKLKMLLSNDFFIYDPTDHEKAWHQPVLQTKFTTFYNIKNKIYLRGDIIGLAGAQARLADGTAQKIKGTADINLGAEYQFTKYLSFFLQLNNLAHMKYERYYNYPTYGFNGLIGVQLSY